MIEPNYLAAGYGELVAELANELGQEKARRMKAELELQQLSEEEPDKVVPMDVALD